LLRRRRARLMSGSRETLEMTADGGLAWPRTRPPAHLRPQARRRRSAARAIDGAGAP
jgi:hypothetical protein